MYRIHFDPRTGEFVIQVSCWWFFWFAVSTNHPLTTYDEARAYVGAIGLDKLYQDRSENIRQSYLRST